MNQLVPKFWLKWCAKMWGVEPKYAAKIWAALDVSPALLYQIGICDTYDAGREVWQGRMRHFRDLLDPCALMRTSLTLSPEDGRPRHADAIRLEEGVLYMLDKHGRWLTF
jgi:hypothetical protein